VQQEIAHICDSRVKSLEWIKAWLPKGRLIFGVTAVRTLGLENKSLAKFLVLLTQWAFERPYLRAEIGAAWGHRIPIVALLLGITAAAWENKEFSFHIPRKTRIGRNHLRKH
jgi:hypothetical protein